MNHLKHVEIQNQENLSDNVGLDYNSCHCELLWAKWLQPTNYAKLPRLSSRRHPSKLQLRQ